MSIFNPPDSYWGTAHHAGGGGSTYFIPTGLQYLSFINRTWSNPSTDIVHTFPGHGWGGWQFKLNEQDENDTMVCGKHF